MLKALLLGGALLPTAYAQDAPAPPRVEIKGLRLGERAAAERLRTKVEPVFPAAAREQHIEGKVLVLIKLDKEGNVTDAKAYSGPEELRDAAVAAVRQWKYEPVVVAGAVVEADAVASVEFHLQDSVAASPAPKAENATKPASEAPAADKPAPTMLRVSQSVAQKHQTKKVTPHYPLSAKLDRVQGTVTLTAVIDTDGSLRDMKVVTSPRSDLTDATLEAVKQWKYEPFRLKGVAIPTQTTINVNFTLMP
jgi:TonB family protein